MNIYKQINIVINYIENNITEKIDLKTLSKISALNQTSLQTIFPLLTGVGIKEYIRKRRLTLSVTDLRNGMKVIDVAVKYQYESPISFSRSFTIFHGLKPSKIKKTDEYLTNFSKIELEEKSLNNNLKYKIVNHKIFNLYGLSTIINMNNIPKYTSLFWGKVKKNTSEFVECEKRYGFLIENEKKYYCCLEYEFTGSSIVTIPKTNYIIFIIKSFKAIDIVKNIKAASNKYIESLKLKQKLFPIVEIYYKDYLEIWIPIY